MLRYFSIILFMYITNVQSTEIDATMNWANIHRVSFVVEGIVSDGVVKIGGKVEKGALLAQLNSQYFEFLVEQNLAKVDQITPLLLDAKLDLHHAEELYERTVLSEVELQKIKGRHETLAARKRELQSFYQFSKWQAGLAILKANEDAYVIDSNILPGMVISKENKADIYIELASVKQAVAIAWLDASQKDDLKLNDKMRVKVAQKTIPATLLSLAMKPNSEKKYRLEAIFNFAKVITPGKTVTLTIN